MCLLHDNKVTLELYEINHKAIDLYDCDYSNHITPILCEMFHNFPLEFSEIYHIKLFSDYYIIMHFTNYKFINITPQCTTPMFNIYT